MKELYNEAAKYLGRTEAKDSVMLNGDLIKYAPNLWRGLNVKTTSWCAGFINMLLAKLGKNGTNSLLARSFLKIGSKVDLKDAQQGDIVVFKRGTSAWQGHVGVYQRHNKDLIWVIGGNQDNSVSSKAYARSRLLGVRRL